LFFNVAIEHALLHSNTSFFLTNPILPTPLPSSLPNPTP
jgi:hypothetical protein